MPDIERELCTCGRPPTDLEARMLPVIRERDEARAEAARLRAAAKRVLEAESATPPVVWQDYLDALEAVDKLAHALRNEEAEVARLREALTAIADGRWNVRAASNVDARQFAREALHA